MYTCPNCGGGLRFHISSQDLFCEYCSTHHDPYQITKHHDGTVSAYYETTVYTCPQCGGEIICEDEEAAAFCSYCGASTILTARLEQLEKPAKIIPFKITKDDCRAAYVSKMKQAYFSPKSIRGEDCIESFRAIYMPFWLYHVKTDTAVKMDGTKTYDQGAYTVTDSYHLSCRVAADYPAIPYDASRSFSDRISSAVLPYDLSGMQKFTPSILSGFYADTANVEKESYQADALSDAREETIRQIKEDPGLEKMDLEIPDEEMFSLDVRDCSCALLPVWFFSYRNKDRVSYAAVNGQTGKVFADTPIDPRRYVVSSLLLALPIYLLLNVFLTLRPQTLLNLSALFLVLGAILFRRNLRDIEDRMADKRMRIRREKAKKEGKLFERMMEVLVLASIILMVGIYPLAFAAVFLDILSPLIVLGYMSVWMISCGKQRSALCTRTLAVSFCAALGILILTVTRPVSDLYYYGGVLLCMGAVLFMIFELIRSYNMLASQPLPQFRRTGGDDRA